MGLTLYCGGDDSNHAGDNRGEVIVVVFSFSHEDSIVKSFPNRRDYDAATTWMNDPRYQRDYRFTILTAEKYRHSLENLPRVMPYLVRSFLETNPLGSEVENMELYLDGRLNRDREQELKEKFLDFPDMKAEGFIKKNHRDNHVMKRHRCPAVVCIADVWAHMIYRRTLDKILEDDKMVVIP